MNVQDGIREKPFEFFCGVFLIVLGIALTAFGTSGSWQIVGGSSAAALGGALLSWSAANVRTRDRARMILQSELETEGRHLADVAAKINRAVQEVLAKDIDPAAAIDRIAQTPSTLYVILNDLQMLAGSKFSSDHLLRTVAACEEQMRSLELQLSTLPSEPKGGDATLDEIREGIRSVAMQLESAQREFSEPGRTVLKESVACPDCGTPVTQAIGTTHGDSAAPVCPACHKRFHAHRAADGSVFSRKWGQRAAAVRLASNDALDTAAKPA